MTRFVGTPLRGIEFATNSDEAISTRVVGDAHAKIRIDAGGRITWSSGSAAGDTNIYRDSANVLKTDDVFIGAGGIVTIATDGAPTQALANGAVAVDITNNVFYFRSDDEWIQVANSSDATSITISPTAPGSPVNGELWFDSDDELLRIYNSGSWVNLTGAKRLDELEDVDLTVLPLDGDVLKYNASASVWTSGSVAAGGATVTISDTPPASPEHGDLWFESDSLDLYIYYNDAFLQLTDSSSGVTDITDLADVLIDNPLIGEALVYNGAEWVNQAVASASVALDSLTDVVITSPTNGQVLRFNGTQWINDAGGASASVSLNDLTDVVVTAPSNGQILKFNGTQWVNDTAPSSGPANTDELSEGTTNLYFTEGRVIDALPQDISASASPTFNTVNADLSGNASTATTLETSRIIELSGDVSGSTSFNGSGNVTINAQIQPDSVELGVDTTGNYVSDVTAGTGVTVTHTPAEGSSPTIAIGQDVASSASVTFAHVSADLSGNVTGNLTGDVTGNADTASTLETGRTISISGEVSGSVVFDGSSDVTINATVQPDSVELGTDTTGNYMVDVVGGTGVIISHTQGEGSSASISIGQDVATSASVTFAHVTADVTGDLTGNADTASALQTARVIELSGDVSGSALFDGTSNINITAVVNTSSVAIGELDGVNIVDPQEFQTLEYNGTEWVNAYASVVSYVRNAETTTLATGTAVYLFGGTGDHASVKRADNTIDATSAKTVGLVGASIAASQNGPVITRGYVDGINLSAYAPGDVLWLGKNGQITKVKPSAPDHLVFIGVVVRATNNGIIYVATQNGYEIDELHNVKINGVTNGQFLRYNSASAIWVNDTIDLGTDTSGNYVQSLVGGTGVTLSNNSGEGSTPTVAIGQDVSTSASVEFHNVETQYDLFVGRNLYVSGSVVTENQVSLEIDDPFIYLNTSASASGIDTGVVASYFDGSHKHAGYFRDSTDGKFKFFDSYTPEPSSPIDTDHVTYSPAPVVAETFESTVTTGTAPFTVSSTTEVTNLHADTASSLHTSRAISLAGDLSGSVSFDGSSDVSITATIQPNSVALGTDTTGNYMADLAEGTGVTIIHTPGEASTASVSIGQSVATSASVTFAHVSADLTGNVVGDLTGNADTASALETARTISLSGDVSGSVTFDGSTNVTITTEVQPDSVALGVDTTGNYVADVIAGAGIGVTHTPGEGSSPTVNLDAGIGELKDVLTDEIYPGDGEFLRYSSASAGWYPTPVPIINALDDIGNVNVSTAIPGDVLSFDGSQWVSASVAAGGASLTISDTPPASPSAGNLWFESDTTRTYVYYDSTWVEIGSTGSGATVSDTAPTSPVQGQIWLNSLNGATYVYYDPVWIEVGAVPVNTLLSTIQAKGDLLVGTASATVDNLAAGTTGQVLTVDPSTATGLKWADTQGGGGLNTSTDGVFITMAIGM